MKRLLFLFLISCATSTQLENHDAQFSISKNFDFSKHYTVALIPLKDVSFDEIYNNIALQLLSIGNFKLVERKDIENVLNEQNFQYTGITENTKISEFGKILNADIIGMYSFQIQVGYESFEVYIFGINYKPYIVNVYLKLISVETGEVLYYGKGRGQSYSKSEAIEEAVKNVVFGLKKGGKR
jgi:curli biogenesis system outer membrane secretion channel CsgG